MSNRIIVSLIGLLAVVLPQVAGAQDFTARYSYPAKFICGYIPDEAETGLGVVSGHYSSVINIIAEKNKTSLAYRATVVTTDLGIGRGWPSQFSTRFDLDRDGTRGIICGEIKIELFGASGEGFMEGYLTVYSDTPLNVTSVVTGEYEYDWNSNVSAMQIIQAPQRKSTFKVTPYVPE